MVIQWFKGKEDFNVPLSIRLKVFVEEQKVPVELEMDENDQESYHLVIFEHSKPIACGRVFEEKNYYHIGRVAVLKEFRGKTYGRVIMENLIKKSRELGGNEVRLDAQIKARGFYEKLGFEIYGDIFMDAGIEHIAMKKSI